MGSPVTISRRQKQYLHNKNKEEEPKIVARHEKKGKKDWNVNVEVRKLCIPPAWSLKILWLCTKVLPLVDVPTGHAQANHFS